MNRHEQFKAEYEGFVSFLKRYVPDVDEYGVLVFFTAAVLKIWGSNLLYSPDYTTLLRTVTGQPFTVEQVVTSLSSCGDPERVLRVPAFFDQIIEQEWMNGGRCASECVSRINDLLVGAAMINGDFTIEEAMALSQIIDSFVSRAEARGRKVVAVPDNYRRITEPKEDSYLQNDALLAEARQAGKAKPDPAPKPSGEDPAAPFTITLHLSGSDGSILGASNTQAAPQEEAPVVTKPSEEDGETMESLQAELEVSLLRRKAEMIRIALNRRQAVDLGAIDAQLEEEKQKQVADLESADKTLNELPELDENQARTLQRQYREITGDFHPAMNSDMTETQKELYQKAVEAYKMQDAEAMKLIYDMLYQPVDRSGYEIAPVDSEDTDEKRRQEYRKIASELTTDYRLAKKLYDAFVPLEEDHVMLDLLEQYGKQRKEVEAEIEQIRAGFPFNAVPTRKRSGEDGRIPRGAASAGIALRRGKKGAGSADRFHDGGPAKWLIIGYSRKRSGCVPASSTGTRSGRKADPSWSCRRPSRGCSSMWTTTATKAAS